MQAAQDSNVTSITDADKKPQNKRKRLLSMLALVVILAGGGFCTYWKLVGSKHITTDNAYAAADTAQITPSTSGIVKAINVIDTQNIKAGDVLVTLDDTDAKIALLKAEAELARAQTEVGRSQASLDRRRQLAGPGYVTAEELNNFENAFKVANANLNLALAGLEQAKVELDRTVIRSPIDGVVAERNVQLGQRVSAGAHLLSIIPISQMYVNANFKEVQLRKLKVGQPVTLHADLYGSKVTYQGHVTGVSGGTGAAFSVIPAQNASGNWIKVVQRLPVRIELDKKNLNEFPLRVGLSMHVDVFTGQDA